MPRYPLAGVTEFIKLLDTPAAYTGQAGKVPAVNTGESALEYVLRMAGVKVRKNTQMPILGTRPQLNFIEGAAIDLKLEDNPPDDEIDIAISAKYPTRFMTLIPEDAILPTASPPALTMVDGANFSYNVLDFDQDAEEKAYWEWFLTPDYLEENIVVDIYWIATPAAGDVKFGFSVLGREKGEAWDAALGAERTVVQPTGGAGVLNKARITTFSPNWTAGDVVLFKLARKAADVADTLAADARVVKVVASYTGKFAQSFYPLALPVELTVPVAGSWQDIDVKGYLPTGATGVILHCHNKSGTARGIGLRKKGSTDNRTQTMDGSPGHFWAMAGVDENRVLQVFSGNIIDIDVYLVGYTATGVFFFDNAYDKSLAVTGAWTDIDLSAECPNAVGIIVEIVASGGAISAGLRKNGSTDERWTSNRFHSWAIIGCDGAQVIEGKIQDVAVDFFIVGYVTEGAVFKTNGDVITPSTVGVWEAHDLSTEAPSGIMLFFEETMNRQYGVRKNGDTEDIYTDSMFGRAGVFVACDSGQKIEGKFEDLNPIYLVGYAQWAGA